jgi:hypothetical protein
MAKDAWKNGAVSTEDMSQKRATVRKDGNVSLPPVPMAKNLADIFEIKCSETLDSIVFKNKNDNS